MNEAREKGAESYNLKSEITGGITAGIIALPLALAFGIASGLGAAAGLWGAIVLGFMAALFGGTKMQISGPTGPMSVVAASIVLKFGDDINSIMAVFTLAGILQIVFGVFRLGGLVKFIPYSVISGFMTGVGFIIIILQLNPMLGVPGVGNTVSAVTTLPATFQQLNVQALLLTIATISIVYLTPKRVASIVPSSLLAIIILTPVVAGLSLPVATIGDIPTGFASLTIPLPSMENIGIVVIYAVTLAVLGSIDSLLTSLVADSITKTRHNSNKELIGQGIGNALVGFVGGIPGAGATMRTVANIKAGGMGRISGMTHSLFLLFVVLIFAPVVGYVPLPVLAGILLKVGIDILDYRLLKRVGHIPHKDLAIMVIVFLLTVFVDLIFAVGVGTFLAWVLYILGIPKNNRKFDIHVLTDSEEAKLVEVKGPMFFATNSRVIERLTLECAPHSLTIDCTNVTFMDISSVYAIEDFIATVDKNSTKIDIVIDENKLSGHALNELKFLLHDNVQSYAIDKS